MKRSEVLDWLIQHTEHIHDIPEQVLSRCDTEVRKHAQEDAWLHARDIAEEHNQHWRHSWGARASETFVAREICRGLADEFKRNEPIPAEGARRAEGIEPPDPEFVRRVMEGLAELAAN